MDCYLRGFQGLESLYFRAFRVFHNVYGLLPFRAFFHQPDVDKRIWNVTSFFEFGLIFRLCIRTVTVGTRGFQREKSPEICVVFCRILAFLDKFSWVFIWKSEFCPGILYTGCYFVFFPMWKKSFWRILLLTVFFVWCNILFIFARSANAALAQLVEHVICNLGVVGPSPTGSFGEIA